MNAPWLQLQKIENIDLWLENHSIIKIEAFDLDVSKIKKAKQQLSKIDKIAYLSSFEDNVEVTDKYAQKGLILSQVIEPLGIKKEEVAVFGDGLNDLSMFELFSESYAVENAALEIKKLAKYYAPSYDQDGVAQMIMQIIEKNKEEKL